MIIIPFIEASSRHSLSRRGRAAAMAAIMALSATLTGPLVLPGTQAHAAEISVTVRERLSNYGGWRTSSRFGDVWVPSVRAEWRPYTEGRWVWTDDGWYWQSTEPFGDVVYHYGRWAYDPDFGWVWISGDQWAPAWVVWRQGGNDVGWAPAPPDVGVAFDDAWWCFVPVAAIGAVDLVRVVRPVQENVVIVRNTTIINQTVVVNNAPHVRLGNQVVAINAGPRLQQFPKPVIESIKAARLVPPPKGVFASARLDASRGAEIKKLVGNATGNGQIVAGPKTASGGKAIYPGAVAASNPVVVKPGDAVRKRMAAGNGAKADGVKPHADRTAGDGRIVVKTSAKPGPAKPVSGQRPARRAGQQKPHQQALAMHMPQHHGPARMAPHHPPAKMQARKVSKCDPRVSRCKAPG
ncbi:DUF6600 domain-containing protein [Mesorhizobium sp. CO1-1-8]|uniref:DUF6600 domain-containing protein n=1 Tax=Mesorhizobium sp. CO1-1-8 TaxID=2876631 RepID=UPI001CD160AB|nr:DUF6600 domain-containing protein [Mesorhizobium sp. CO1-1-8]MBZ9773390.1 hypothetical protein [Mesorhizobium sp. CO1-1-8]